MRVYITGVAGLLGSNLAKRFLSLGYQVSGCDSLIGGYKDNIPEKTNFKQLDLTYDSLNLEYRKNFEKHISGSDIIIHCACFPHEGVSPFSPSIICDSIYSATSTIVSLGISCQVPLFINMTSMARYGNNNPPFSEDIECYPQDPYGLAKLQTEQLVNLLSDIHLFKVIHICPHSVAGPGQVYTDPHRNVMSIFANRILQNKNIYVYGNGEQKRSFSHIDDCVDAILEVINQQNIIQNKELFNIGPGINTEITINQLIEIIGNYCKIKPIIQHLPDRICEVKEAYVSCEKAEKILNYKARYSIEKIVEDNIKWIKKRGIMPFNYYMPLEIKNDPRIPITWTQKLI